MRALLTWSAFEVGLDLASAAVVDLAVHVLAATPPALSLVRLVAAGSSCGIGGASC